MIVDRTEQDITNRGIDKTMSNIDIMKKYMEGRERDNLKGSVLHKDLSYP